MPLTSSRYLHNQILDNEQNVTPLQNIFIPPEYPVLQFNRLIRFLVLYSLFLMVLYVDTAETATEKDCGLVLIKQKSVTVTENTNFKLNHDLHLTLTKLLLLPKLNHT